MSDPFSLLNVHACDFVATGTCVVLNDGEIVFAGPIQRSGDVNLSGKDVLVSAEDFEKFSRFLKSRRH